MIPITIEEVEYLAFQLAKKHMEWDEPIPDFSTRFPGLLESCLANAFQTYAKKELYPTLLDKAAIIFYQMIKNDPFVNGNKRIAVTTLLTLLFLNHKWLEVDNEQLYRFAVWVAESESQLKRGVTIAIRDFVHKNLRDLQ